MAIYADVILPLAVDGCFTYLVPEEFEAQAGEGIRVVVPLGRSKYYSGIISALHSKKPPYKNIKRISSIASAVAVASPGQMRFWQWLAEYYMCSQGEVMRSAVPAALKSSGRSDDITESYSQKRETFVTLSPELDCEESLHAALDSLKRAKVQHAALIQLADNPSPVNKSRFNFPHAVIRELERKGFIKLEERVVDRQYDASYDNTSPLPQLTKAQADALDSVKSCFKRGKTALLHGVTGSGKTEIYIHLISETLAAGKDVLYLLPEISVTAQLIERLKGYFGNSVLAYHSGLGDNMRAECYLKLLKPVWKSAGKQGRAPLLIIGVRSSLLLPHDNTGLVVVDEEHENTYKQQEPAPRYHARDAAIMLAGMNGANVLLGSATPSIESYFNAVTGKYGLVELSERYGGASLPHIVVADTVRAAKRGEKSSHFTHLLLEGIARALDSGRQAVLFQNRRGFSPYVECAECFTVPSCANCNVSLTYHRSTGSLVCHYCGYTVPMPSACPTCGSADIKTRGFGTEKVEEELSAIFPEAAVARLDLDAVTSARSYSRIISDFEKGRTDILIGTQMVSKGFDFGNLSLAGVLNADNMLNYPDFRASERSFQLMVQVAGRAGRRGEQGEVIIQTSQPHHPVIKQVLEGDYGAMFRSQSAERRHFLYPPFCRLIKFTLRHADIDILRSAAADFEAPMRRIFGKRLLGPETPAVDKVRGEYLCGFLLKIEKERSAAEAKRLVREVLYEVVRKPGYASLTVITDVDPQ